MTQNFQIDKVLSHLSHAREVASWNYCIDKRLGNYDIAYHWSATLGHIDNAIARIASHPQAQKTDRHPGWTDAGHAWLDAGAPLLKPTLSDLAPAGNDRTLPIAQFKKAGHVDDSDRSEVVSSAPTEREAIGNVLGHGREHTTDKEAATPPTPNKDEAR